MERNILWNRMNIRSYNETSVENRSANPALGMVKEKKPKFEGRRGYRVSFRLPWSTS